MSHDALPDFTITVAHVHDVAVLTIRGELDLATAPLLSESIDAVFAEAAPSGLIIDLTAVPFLASMGMTALVRAQEHIGASLRLAVVAHGPATSRPLTLMGLDQTFEMYTELTAAMTALAS